MSLFWTLGTYHIDGRITLVRAADWSAAAAALGVEFHLVHSCTTPELIQIGGAYKDGQAWTCRVDATPAHRDRFTRRTVGAREARRDPRID